MSAPDPSPGFAWRMTAGFYAGVFGALGAHMPFWPMWLSDWGLADGEIGALMGAAVAARVAAGVLAPWFADATGRRRTALALLGGLGIAVYLAHLGVGAVWALAALTLMASVALAGALPIGDALGAAAARLHGFSYARARAMGSAAFLFANLACGWAVAVWGVDAALWWIVACLALMTLFALRHPGGARDGLGRPRIGDALRLARRRPFLLAAAASALVQASHGPLYAYGSLHWRAQGISETTIGALWAVGVAFEVALMALIGGWIIARLGVWGAFALAAAAACARWSAMALDPAPGWLWLWQASHALTFTPTHLAMIAFVTAAAPARLSASAQGLIGAGLGGAAMAAATLGAAAVYPVGGPAMFWLGLALALLGLIAALGLRRSWDGGALAA